MDQQSQIQAPSSSQEKVLVTGGIGYIGSHTVVELINEGYDVLILDNLYNSKMNCLERLKKITGQQEIKFVNADLKKFEEVDQIFESYKPTAVIHFAALKAVGESVAKPLEYYDNNISGTINLLRVMQKHKCNKIVFSSSACVYGDGKDKCVEEDSGIPTNPYGQTKTMIEQILKDYAKANSEFLAISLRYFNPVGAHPSGLIGEDPQGIPNNLMPYIQKVASGQLKQLTVFGNDYNTQPDGTGVRDYIHVVDLAKGHTAALRKKELKGFQVFNLGTGNGTSVLQLVHAFEKVSGIKIPYVMGPRRAGDVAQLLAIPDKANRELGWKTELGIDEMCRDSYNWVKNNPNGYD